MPTITGEDLSGREIAITEQTYFVRCHGEQVNLVVGPTIGWSLEGCFLTELYVNGVLFNG